ncbi:hypothetical protein [Shinella oryzae]|uniref:hypothetical protein n=1 Tax=Shinella oryzae TaxID=2871820 RepID=UPI001FF21C2F|nr:hypothetical protein [Shinella oryzae]UPA26975.1 hypothetical protein K6301_24000 [Shinella oryzae]
MAHTLSLSINYGYRDKYCQYSSRHVARVGPMSLPLKQSGLNAQPLFHRPKGSRRCVRNRRPMYHPNGIYTENKLHPTQKTVEVLEQLSAPIARLSDWCLTRSAGWRLEVLAKKCAIFRKWRATGVKCFQTPAQSAAICATDISPGGS